jgi:Ala-tRNA(Pro) deacylase
MNVTQLLRTRGILFERIVHHPQYDAQRLAETVGVSGHRVVKTVLLRTDQDYLLAVLPATHQVDLAQVAQNLRAKRAALATEEEIAERFSDCQLGAIPPFGSYYGITTLIDQSLADDEEIVFEGNTHDEAIRMRFEDFRELEKPVVTTFAYQE